MAQPVRRVPCDNVTRVVHHRRRRGGRRSRTRPAEPVRSGGRGFSRGRSGAPRGAAGRECSFISRVGPRQQDSDVEDIEADRSRQVPVSESSPEQSYDLERDRRRSAHLK